MQWYSLIWNPPLFNFHCDTITHGKPNSTLVLHTILVVAGSYAMTYQFVCLHLNRVLISESGSYVSLLGMVIGMVP
jgi:hypothetical protein